VLRQRDKIRMLSSKPGFVVHHAGLRRIPSRKQRRARRIAERILSVSPLEPHPAPGQTIYVRRFDQRVVVTTQLRPQVVRSDEEDVVCRLFRRRRRVRRLMRSKKNTKQSQQKRPHNVFHIKPHLWSSRNKCNNQRVATAYGARGLGTALVVNSL